MVRFLTSTTLAAALVAPLAAQAQMVDISELIRTRDITGAPVHSIAAQYDETTWGETEGSWDAFDINGDGVNQIGEIEDVVLNPSGEKVGVVAEIGGFLDPGDKHVMVEVGDVRLVAIDDANYAYVTRLSEEQLESLESVDEA
ncbi:PRC-barrel domain-containing protein [Jannaschia seohaensis]|uniref:PRC-barrel domain protein n=1 Tax=Jannaschia seohaensis TaxID=475081 RepID=A0A2Y9AVQ9_9RHOB|nr:PRC-barrel domain-containing protein [Jannaschia seohaensis]PWJ18092.1 PRC-barrel domain protein [Jannaschia seohaensis]SSA46617.1 PRC-barrel domain-containing protein [Jannaschia seohaensis]